MVKNINMYNGYKMYAATLELAKQKISNTVNASTVGRGQIHWEIPRQSQSVLNNPTGSGARDVMTMNTTQNNIQKYTTKYIPRFLSNLEHHVP
mmetsp:Transcript_46688/g.113773  ORF Transcript_46688/g.113773 Transcript_46688/m.113773 type:complete len:93 (-) Transcript_46688:344-622(-)